MSFVEDDCRGEVDNAAILRMVGRRGGHELSVVDRRTCTPSQKDGEDEKEKQLFRKNLLERTEQAWEHSLEQSQV